MNRIRLRRYFTITMLLLYEATYQVHGVPVGISGGAAPHLSSLLENPEYHKPQVMMPIWARKAGGNWRAELVQDLVKDLTTTGRNTEEYVPVGENENFQDTDDVSDPNIKRAEDNSEQIREKPTQDKSHLEENVEEKGVEANAQKSDDDYAYDYDEIRPEEQECPEDKYWHIRGLKCVPFDCPGGNAWRDRDTGDCILKYYGYRNRWRSRPWRP